MADVTMRDILYKLEHQQVSYSDTNKMPAIL